MPPLARPFDQAHDGAPLERRAITDVTRMEHDTYEYRIEVSDADFIVGGRFRFVGTVVDLCRHHDDGRIERFATPFGQYHGEDADEAESRARERVECWIEAQRTS